MQILFSHQNDPAQFGHVAMRLAERSGWKVTFLSRNGKPDGSAIRRIRYVPIGGATEKTHYASRTFENLMAHSHGMVKAVRAAVDCKPDLIVGHSGFGSTSFLRDVVACPQINYFEYFYRVMGSDMDFRPDVPVDPMDQFRARARNAGLLLDLESCDAGYSPTEWQTSLFPAAYRSKLKTIFDGIDTAIWKPGPKSPRMAGRFSFPNDIKIVTYAARGFESIRGFDRFMAFSKILAARRQDVRFVVVGSDKMHYGGDEKRTGGKTYRQWVMEQDNYDRNRYAFVGTVAPATLARLFQITDLHVYLTVPFVLSWSLLNAMACGSVVLGSETAPVREMIEPGKTGLLADFFDAESMAKEADRVLSDAAEYAPLGQAAAELILEKYSLEVCLPQLTAFFETVANGNGVKTTPVTKLKAKRVVKKSK